MLDLLKSADPVALMLIGGSAALAASLLLDMAGDAYRRWRRRHAPLPAKGQLLLFDSEGGNVLSAHLPTPALQKLLDDFNGGRLD